MLLIIFLLLFVEIILIIILIKDITMYISIARRLIYMQATSKRMGKQSRDSDCQKKFLKVQELH